MKRPILYSFAAAAAFYGTTVHWAAMIPGVVLTLAALGTLPNVSAGPSANPAQESPAATAPTSDQGRSRTMIVATLDALARADISDKRATARQSRAGAANALKLFTEAVPPEMSDPQTAKDILRMMSVDADVSAATREAALEAFTRIYATDTNGV